MAYYQAHDSNRDRGVCFYDYSENVGQNVAKKWGPASFMKKSSDRQSFIDGINGWYNEVSSIAFQDAAIVVHYLLCM